MYSAQPMLGPQPRCCGCIPLRIGSGIICVFWAVSVFCQYLKRGEKLTLYLFARESQCI